MPKSSGFTLVELMITLAILGVLVTAALPSFRVMMQNYQARVAAESVANGLQRARGEAVARNANVQFVLAASGTAWTVDYVNKPVPTDPPLDSRQSTEGSQNATRVAVASDLTTPATTITYNNLGQVVANADASLSLSQITFTASGGNQSLVVKINAGGSARLCDPSLPATNVRSCSHP